MVKQMLNQEEKKGGRQKWEWGEFEKRRSREQFESKQLGGQQLHYVGPRW